MGKQSSKAAELGAAKLKSSGIEPSLAKSLGMKFLAPFDTAKLHPSFKPLCSLQLNYHDPAGKPLPDLPAGKPFYRLRYLETPTDFSGQSEKKQPRYVQEPATVPVAYYPLNEKWGPIIGDPSKPVVITEGELKAAAACEHGFATIGIGGVYNWRSHKLGIEWLPSLDLVTWLRRNIYVCFDSDYVENPMVCQALRELADALNDRGSFVHLVVLPTLVSGEKTGLDDFLLAEGVERFQALLHDAEPLGLTKPLWSLNERYVYVQNPGLVVEQRTRYKVAPAAFKEHLEAPLSYQARELKMNGDISYEKVSAAAFWLKWPLRRSATKLVYKPGDNTFTTEGDYNTWPGWGLEPVKGDVSPFLDLLDHLFTNAEPAAKTWFLRWCAFPLQNPGHKMFSSSVIHGVRHGTGKSLIGYTLGKIYGDNFTEIAQQDLHSSFNEWAESRQFVMADDISGSNKRQDADLLKKLITQQRLRVNVKYVPSYTITDCINYLFTANHPDSFFLEDDDRRFFIHEVIVPPLSEDFYADYDLWLHGRGPSYVFHYLLNLDLGDFNPNAPAFKTAAKSRMIANVQSDLATWVRDLLATPEHVLRIGEVELDRDLFTSRELLVLYSPTGSGNLTANGVGRELARAGIPQAVGGKPLRTPDGGQARYFIVRNREKWLNASFTDCSRHVAQAETKPKQKY